MLAHKRRPDDAAAPEHALVLGFVSAAYGLLLGLLVVTAMGHFNDVRTEAQKEASSLIALHDTLNIYTPATREPAQHDLVCYMRSIVDDEWPSMARGSEFEATADAPIRRPAARRSSEPFPRTERQRRPRMGAAPASSRTPASHGSGCCSSPPRRSPRSCGS